MHRTTLLNLLDGQGLAKFAVRATPVFQRQPGKEATSSPQVAHWLEVWSKQTADGHLDRLGERLALENHDLRSVRQLLAQSGEADVSIPNWVVILSHFLHAPYRETAWSQAEDIPFQELLQPLVVLAWKRLTEEEGVRLDLLHAGTLGPMKTRLLRRLSAIAAKTLYEAFQVYRQRHSSGLERMLGRLQPSASRRIYQGFHQHLISGGWGELFDSYPVLGRLLCETVERWVTFTARWLWRLDRDRQILAETFNKGQDPGLVVAVSPGLSDAHNGGQAVIALTFAGGLKVVYKPRPMAMEAAFNQFLAWIEPRFAGLSLYRHHVVSRAGYGWAEWVPHRFCVDEDQVRRFHQRSGMLMCLVTLLGGTDMHHENLIAMGEDPVLIDLETLMNNDLKADGRFTTAGFYAGEAWDTVLRTGFLPNWMLDEDDNPLDVSALGSFKVQKSGQQQTCWRNVNTDAMEAYQERVPLQPRQNLPSPAGGGYDPSDYLDSVCSGFAEMYTFMLAQKEEIMAGDGPLKHFRGLPFRFLMRPTQTYAQVGNRGLQPRYLQEGADRTILLDVLARESFGPASSPLARHLLSDEVAALERLDIPYFLGRTDGTGLGLNHGLMTEAFAASSWQLTRQRIGRASREDLKRQLGFIKGAFKSCEVIRPKVAGATDTRQDLKADFEEKKAGEALEEIFRIIEKGLIPLSSRAVTWMSLEYLGQIQRCQLRPMGFALYNGHCGLAVFLAAYGRFCGREEAKKLAYRAIQPIREALSEDPGASPLGAMPVGAGFGLGSLVYGLVLLADFLADDSLLEDAAKAALLLDRQRLEQDLHRDVVLGNAGALLGLLTLFQAKGSTAVLDQAVSCGHLLIGAMIPDGHGGHAWRNGEGKMGSGFSHGAAGIGFALHQLYRHTGDKALLDAVSQARSFENQLYDPTQERWLYERPANENMPGLSQVSWCHGAPGIALGRSLLLEDLPAAAEDAALAARLSADCLPLPADHLCCGTMGVVDILLETGSRLNRPEWVAVAREAAARTLALADAEGHFQLDVDAPDWPNLTLFKGLSGIGYTLLRLLYPRQLPCLLRFQPP